MPRSREADSKGDGYYIGLIMGAATSAVALPALIQLLLKVFALLSA